MTDRPLLKQLDARQHAVDHVRRVADSALRGQLPGDWTWLTPQPRVAASGRVCLRISPDAHSAQVTEALFGQVLELLEERENGWGWVRTLHDGYLGFAPLDALTGPPAGRTLQVSAPRGHLFAAPNITAPILDELSCGSQLAIQDAHPTEEKGRLWWRTGYAGQDAYVQATLTDPVEGGPFKNLAFIRRFLDTPYVWGGRSAWGIDCSGLSQLFHGDLIPRDVDQQEAFLGRVEAPQAGDLAFFPGHVGIMLNARDLLHANATHMCVTIETLGEGRYGERLARELRGYGRWRGAPPLSQDQPA